MKTNRQKAIDLLTKMLDAGVTEEMLLDFIVNDYMSGDEALNMLQEAEIELFDNPDDLDDDSTKSRSFEEED